MMKKFYLFLAMLLGIFGSSVLSAQEEHKFSRTETIQIGPAVNAFEPNTWYFMHQGRPFNVDGALDHQVVLGQIPSGEGGVISDQGLNKNIVKEDYTPFCDAVPAKVYAGYVVRFVPVSGKEGAYLVQFGTNNYMSTPAGSGNSQTFKAVESIYDAGEFNVYYINDASYVVDENHPNYACFGFNVYNMGQRVDNNGTGTTLVTWGSGKREKIEAGNSIWNIHEVIWGTADELEALLTELETIWGAHENDVEYYKENIGTQPGQYPEDVVNAFVEAMQFGYDLLDEKVELTVENVEKAIADIPATYQAVVDAKIPYIPADGYYRLRSGMTFTQNEETFVKYLYTAVNGTTINARWQTPEDLSTDASVLWQLTKQDEGYDFVNVATNARFNNVAKSTNVTLSTSGANLMAFDVAAIVEDVTYVNVRVATQASNDYYYLHTGGHNGGAGVSGNIVGWSKSFDTETGSAKGSEWVLEPVSDDDVTKILEAFEELKQREQFVADYKALKAEAAAAIDAAKDMETINLITENSQFSSPWTDPEEGSLNNLLDGKTDTFWHSSWHSDPPHANNGDHYLQVELPDGYYSDGLMVAFRFSRRTGANNDHVTKWLVKGTNENLTTDLTQPLVDKEQCEELLVAETPYAADNVTVTSDKFDSKGYKYLRFYAEATTNNRCYWHVSEMQIFYQRENPNSQYSFMGEVAVNLDKVLADQTGIADADITQATYDALKNAYDAFKAEFVDPAELRALIAELKDKPAIVTVGAAPGFWPDKSTATALQETLNAATAYDEGGVYAATKSNQFIETLRSQSQAIDDAAIAVEPGKWYRIRFGTEEEFEDHEWDKVAGEYGTKTTYKDVEYETSEPLWGKYVAIADAENEVLFSDDEGKVNRVNIVAADVEKVGIGHGIRLDDTDDIKNSDLSYFRFVEVGDAYALQNKATGLFVKAAGTSGATTLDIIPSLFKVSALGYGLNVMASQALLTGEDQKYLHAQVAGNTLVTWGPDFEPYPGSRSGFFIEEVEDVDDSYDGTAFKLNLSSASIAALCYPVDIAAEKGLYGVSKVEVDATENNVALTLVALQEVEAGRPFILIPSKAEGYDAEADAQSLALRHGYTFVTEPQTDNLLKGTFTNQTVGYGVVVPEGDGFVVAKQTNASVSAFHAWVAEDEKFDREATASYVITDDPDGIAASLQKVTKSGAIYTIDGRLVTKNGNLNSLRGMTPGIYIVNGVKVTIK